MNTFHLNYNGVLDNMKVVGFLIGLCAGVLLGTVATALFLTYPRGDVVTVGLKLDTSLAQSYTLFQNGAVVIFTQNNETVLETKAWFSPVQNVTIAKGEYVLKIYAGDSGAYVKSVQTYILEDTVLTLHV